MHSTCIMIMIISWCPPKVGQQFKRVGFEAMHGCSLVWSTVQTGRGVVMEYHEFRSIYSLGAIVHVRIIMSHCPGMKYRHSSTRNLFNLGANKDWTWELEPASEGHKTVW